ncbi:MAG: glycosyltransferase [Rickettsiales bacterium]|nr:glycosyltransferase [Rickettsiales bacterium]
MPKISLLLINYNKEKYLRDALESVRRQTFRDWECIIVDDGSTDDSIKIIKKYCRHDARFRLISQENAGCQSARNTAMNEATAEYVMFLDSDDCMTEDAMSSLMAAREIYSADITYGTCRYAPDEYKYTGIHAKCLPAEPKLCFFGRRPDFYKLLDIDMRKFRFCWCWLCLFPRRLLSGLAWNSEIHQNSDAAFMTDVLARADTVAVVDSIIVMHRDSPSSISRESFNEKSVQWCPRLLRHIRNPLHKIGGKFETCLHRQIMGMLFHNNLLLPLMTGRYMRESCRYMQESELRINHLRLWKRILIWLFIRAF